ncbi:hypothetical protein GOHSU_19_00040 [Gordonia hirsuta DSM 44140 = NBRC 16056]|uniref:Uncharacterized protein n=1 Tax=Gordonia hirsuta DSM 44140 = NBRC 16056 TaxID=1121927 RepID=L7L9H5_9ACTN|nr:hypothetical protein [Gordonia hirsuta]GAC57401.1 hypothetical protein GOHSU_19_00040 [Gordonia hirsuta DSM 44140 = NBRC 16056]
MTAARLTAHQAVEAQTAREIHAAAYARLGRARRRGFTAADLTDFSDAMREVQARENAMRRRWWPTAVSVQVGTLGEAVEVLVYPTTDPTDAHLLTLEAAQQ